MDLKIKDVADLLNVSETTIRRWLTDGKIPAYRIHHQYRFNRQEIEDWVMCQKIGKFSHPPSVEDRPKGHGLKEDETKGASRGSKQFSLYRALHKGQVIHDLPEEKKEPLIRSSMKKIAHDLGLDADVISDLLMDRENLQPTSLNHGIAIPHTRDFLLNQHFDMVSIVFPKHPIEYGALDGKPVHTLFFLFASDDKKHLHLLAKIAHLSSQPTTHEFLKTKPSKEQFLEFVKEWESSLQQG